MKTGLSPKRFAAFSLIELMIVVAIVALLTSIAVPNFARARDNSRLTMIYSNLRALDAAKDRWAMENNKNTGAAIPDVTTLSNYFRLGGLQDVIHETYVANDVGTPCHATLPPGVGLGPFAPGATIPAP